MNRTFFLCALLFTMCQAYGQKLGIERHLYQLYSNEIPTIPSKSGTGKGQKLISISSDEKDNGGLEKYTYDAKGNNIQSIGAYNYDETAKKWKPSVKDEFVYDPKGNMIRYTAFVSLLSGWSPHMKYDYVYDRYFYRTSSTSYMYNKDLKKWNIDYKTESVYDSSGNMLLQSSLSGTSGQWKNTIKEEYEYIPGEKKIKSYMRYVMNGTGNWEPVSKEEYTYVDNKKATCTTSKWTSGIKESYLSEKQEFRYDEKGKINQIVHYSWQHLSNEWKPSARYEFTYDLYGNPVESILYFIIDESGELKLLQKCEYAYDTTCPFSSLMLPKGLAPLGAVCVNKLDSISLYKRNFQENSWQLKGTITLTYSK